MTNNENSHVFSHDTHVQIFASTLAVLADPFALRASFGGVVAGLGNNDITGCWAALPYPFMTCLTFCLASDIFFTLCASLDVAALSVGSGCEICVSGSPVVAVVYPWMLKRAY